MNYRHIYHAGNFADVMKHLTLCLCLDHFKKKEVGFFALDAHGGIGQYDLNAPQAQKTNEWQSGIGKFIDGPTPVDFSLYFDFIKDDLKNGIYFGSPLLIAKNLRPQDRLIANELHEEDVETLRANLRPHKNAQITMMDAYQSIRANIPPKEKRGIILIDPPFEKTDEFEKLARQMEEWKKRFASGVYILWYPIKAHLPIGGLKEAAMTLNIHRTWCFETLMHRRESEGTFNGSGVILFNAPYQIPERITALCPFLKARMGLFDTSTQWLVGEAG